MSGRQERLRQRTGGSTFALAPSPGEPELPGMAEWRARQQRAAAAALLRSELESFAPTPASSGKDPDGSD